MSKILKAIIALLVIIAAALSIYLLWNRTTSPADNSLNGENNVADNYINSLLVVDAEEVSTLPVEKVREHLIVSEGESVSEMELEALYYMEEEEKLAHDIYVALGEKWNLRPFQNIANAEASHTASTVAVLEAYGYESKQSSELGIFHNSELQELYIALLGDGSVSSQEALAVGAVVEEVDIVDLDKYLELVENEDVIILFENLKKGSENHLRAFVRNYEKVGDEYFPQFLEDDYFYSVINR